MSEKPHKIAVVGIGKIARDQHLPSIEADPDFELTASVSRNASVEGVANFTTLEEMLQARPDIGCVALCTPPQVRYAQASAAIAAGRHVLLEKPPGAGISEVEDLIAQADDKGVSLYATWHSRHAPAVEQAGSWLADKTIRSFRIIWKEDVRRWHPGQRWIWQAGGLGVFDPGINALSIVTKILPDPMHLVSATLEFPENCDTPIAADLRFTDRKGTEILADFDWRQTGPQSWYMEADTDAGHMLLDDGGAKLVIDGKTVFQAPPAEYEGIYARFAALLAAGRSDVDLAPLRHVADAFMLGRRTLVEAFED